MTAKDSSTAKSASAPAKRAQAKAETPEANAGAYETAAKSGTKAASAPANRASAKAETPERGATQDREAAVNEVHNPQEPDRVAMVSRRADGGADQTPGFEVLTGDASS